MTPELRELYQSLIIDHGRNPRCFHEIEDHTHKLEGYNPLCGDKITLYMKVKDGVINKIGFTGSGCAISMASASLMSEALQGKPVTHALLLQKQFNDMVTGKNAGEQPIETDKLGVLGGVREFPARVKCATLAWHTLLHALSNEKEPVTTE